MSSLHRASSSFRERLRYSLKKTALGLIDITGANSLFANRYSGTGVIVMFHEVVREPRGQLGQGVTPQDLDYAIRLLRRRGRDIVDLDTALNRLQAGDPRPFAVLTFDDGYRNNLTQALPILEDHNAPATIYVPTGMPTAQLDAWWLGLRQLFLEHNRLEIEPMDRVYMADDRATKAAGFREVIAWVWDDFSRVNAFGETYRRYGLSMEALVRCHAMSETELQHIHQSPLITIGGHTTAHFPLALLETDQVRREIADNRSFLQNLLQDPIDHFAYPFGRPAIDGEREAAIVRDLGFKTAVTTDVGGLFETHKNDPYLWPRETGEYDLNNASALRNAERGVYRALKSRFGSPIANDPRLRPHVVV